MGGLYPGVLPISGRIIAALSAVVLMIMAVVVFRQARGQIGVRWPIWGVICLTAMTTLSNLVSPSDQERYLWAPFALVMLVCVLRVWWIGVLEVRNERR